MRQNEVCLDSAVLATGIVTKGAAAKTCPVVNGRLVGGAGNMVIHTGIGYVEDRPQPWSNIAREFAGDLLFLALACAIMGIVAWRVRPQPLPGVALPNPKTP